MFSSIKSDSLKSIELFTREEKDLKSNTVHPKMSSNFALILLHRSRFLFLFSLLENRPRKLILIIKLKDGTFEALIANEITMKNENDLIISDHSNGLWMAQLNKIKQSKKSKDFDYFIEVKYLGPLLGTSRAITIPPKLDKDIDRYLYYYIPRDGAVVRWNFR